LRAAQTDTDVIPPAQSRRQPHNLLFITAVTVEKDQKRVGIIGFVSCWQKRTDRQRLRSFYFRRVKAFNRPKHSPGKISVRHAATYRAKGNGCSSGRDVWISP